MNTEELLLRLLGDLNQNMQNLTGEVHQLRSDLALNKLHSEQNYTAADRRLTALEKRADKHEDTLKGLDGVAEVAKQIKKWVIFAAAAGLVLAAIAAVVLIPLAKALHSG